MNTESIATRKALEVAMKRIQFEAGLSLTEFLRRYGREAQCHAALEAARWPEGFVCPQCDDFRHSVHSRAGKKVMQCKNCRAQTTLTAGTVFEGSKLPLTDWFLAMYLLSQSQKKLSALALSRRLEISYSSASLMRRKLLKLEDARRADGAARKEGCRLPNMQPRQIETRAGAQNHQPPIPGIVSLWPAWEPDENTSAPAMCTFAIVPQSDERVHRQGPRSTPNATER